MDTRKALCGLAYSHGSVQIHLASVQNINGTIKAAEAGKQSCLWRRDLQACSTKCESRCWLLLLTLVYLTHRGGGGRYKEVARKWKQEHDENLCTHDAILTLC